MLHIRAASPCRRCRQQQLECPGRALLGRQQGLSQKISKWVRNSLRCVTDKGFWLLLCLAHRTREPLLHFYRILNKSPEHGDQPIVELVGRRLQCIAAEYEDLLRTFWHWTEMARRESGASDAPVNEVALLLLLHGAAAFDRRVAAPFRRLLGQSCGAVNTHTHTRTHAHRHRHTHTHARARTIHAH